MLSLRARTSPADRVYDLGRHDNQKLNGSEQLEGGNATKG